MGAQLPAGTAWQCLRCGAFVPGEPALSGPAAAAPEVPRGKELRSRLILRFFALERFIRAVLAGAAAVALWRFVVSRTSLQTALNRDLPIVRDFLHNLGINVGRSKVFGLLQHALTLSPRTVAVLAIAATAYAVIELVEGVGLWLSKRWGEYFAMVATSLGLPFEIYDLTRKVTVTALGLLALNLLLVLYLVLTKRLFGVRGGKAAYDARLRSESVLEAAEKAVAATRRPSDPRIPQPDFATTSVSATAANSPTAPADLQ
ncbi:MAG: DUF2127 domain-containing protein [Actinobacteria bacterium]|nr:DUF2127 domain-containing protein [Actinomycetota bacterium]